MRLIQFQTNTTSAFLSFNTTDAVYAPYNRPSSPVRPCLRDMFSTWLAYGLRTRRPTALHPWPFYPTSNSPIVSLIDDTVAMSRYILSDRTRITSCPDKLFSACPVYVSSRPKLIFSFRQRPSYACIDIGVYTSTDVFSLVTSPPTVTASFL